MPRIKQTARMSVGGLARTKPPARKTVLGSGRMRALVSWRSVPVAVHDSFKEHLKQAAQTGDVKIVCEDGTILDAHKAVLATASASSEVIQGEKWNIGASSVVVKVLLEYVYKACDSDDSPDELFKSLDLLKLSELIHTAHKYSFLELNEDSREAFRTRSYSFEYRSPDQPRLLTKSTQFLLSASEDEIDIISSKLTSEDAPKLRSLWSSAQEAKEKYPLLSEESPHVDMFEREGDNIAGPEGTAHLADHIEQVECRSDFLSIRFVLRKRLLSNEETKDLFISCTDGESLRAHKAVLASVSPFFMALFFGNMKITSDTWQAGVSSTHMRVLIDYVYCGEWTATEEADEQDLITLFLKAHECQVLDVAIQSAFMMVQKLDLDNIKDMMAFALQHNARPERAAQPLLEGCFEFFHWENLEDEFLSLLEHPAFLDVMFQSAVEMVPLLTLGNIKKMLTLAVQYRGRPNYDVDQLLRGCFDFIRKNKLTDTLMLWLNNPEDHGLPTDKEFLKDSIIKFFVDSDGD